MRNPFNCTTTIKANVSLMFESIEPWDVSNSEANLGSNAGSQTWGNALKVGENHTAWLTSDLGAAVEGMRHWARETGAWEEEEIGGWSDVECLASFAQNIASELRDLGADDQDLLDCAGTYSTDVDNECVVGHYGHYEVIDDCLCVEFYTGI